MAGSVSEYRDLFVERVAADLPDVKTRVVDAKTVELTWPDGQKIEVDVARSYEAASSEPDRQDHLLGRLVKGAEEEKAGALAPRADRLVAVVRSKTLLADLGDSAKALVVRPIVGDLIQALAIDADHTLRYADSEDLAALKLSEQEAWALAIQNLPKRIGPVSTEEIEDTGVSGVSAESGLALSLILAANACSAAPPEGQNGQIILVMDREFFAVANTRVPQTLSAFWRLNAIVEKAGDGYSHTPITCSSGRWVVAKPPKG